MDLMTPDISSVLLFLGLVTALIFFLINQQDTLKLIQPQNRAFSPGKIWLQLIPLFNIVWQFFVVMRVSESITREIESWRKNSVEAEFKIPEGLEPKRIRSAHDVGFGACVLGCISLLPYVIGQYAFYPTLISWIVYWVKLAEIKRKIQAKTG